MKKFCTSSREYAKNIIDLEKKKMSPLAKEKLKSYQDAKLCYICRKRILKNAKDKNYQKVRDYCHYAGENRGAAHSICHLKSNLPNEIPVVFHNGSSSDPHFVIKELANEFEEQFKCLAEKKEKYKAFSVIINKQITKIDKDGNENIETISYKIKFIGRMRFVATSLSKLVDNLAEEIHKIKWKD